jgi:hypothetical protein
MTDTDTALPTRPHTAAARPSVGRPATVAVALCVASLIPLLVRDTNDGPVWRVSLITGVTVAVVTAVVFRLVVRRTLAKQSPASSTRAALILGILAVLSNAAFWMAVPPIFGVAAVALAIDARDRRPFRRQWLALIAGALGVIGTAAGLVLSFVG